VLPREDRCALAATAEVAVILPSGSIVSKSGSIVSESLVGLNLCARQASQALIASASDPLDAIVRVIEDALPSEGEEPRASTP
jgi:hypothetical protein